MWPASAPASKLRRVRIMILLNELFSEWNDMTGDIRRNGNANELNLSQGAIETQADVPIAPPLFGVRRRIAALVFCDLSQPPRVGLVYTGAASRPPHSKKSIPQQVPNLNGSAASAIIYLKEF